MKGYKAFNEDLTCRGFQYEIGKTYEMEGKLIICKKGFHFCKTIGDTYKFYPMDGNTRICEIEALGAIATENGTKFCTNKIKIVKEVTDSTLRKGNTGASNSGYCNSGNYNSGDHNSGDNNYGDYNSGDWNFSSYNSGCFCTEDSNIKMFDKDSNWTYREWYISDAHTILSRCPHTETIVKWIDEPNMSKEEKKDNPSYLTTGGYLKVTEENIDRQEWWDNLSEEDKNVVMSLPNFDADKFYICTGIKVK